ncbi:GGDEF domain-containing protein [Oryzicola mucosus]|uniref:diguanylate cyclase n=1 Tax=Oryzicola mucosus TaxID=2767425 RepID=A0A8J6PY83_9HYPH|nr:GGDEF domain-containing protein [Oryzicola mucosus]MBD0416603.1 GGDEF domain-containing protein [Oryzicola mucosus]
MPDKVGEIDSTIAAMMMAALQSGHVGICLCDETDAVRFVNDAFRAAFFPNAPRPPFDFVDALVEAIESENGIQLQTMKLEAFAPRVRERRRNGDLRYDFAVDMYDGSWWWINDHRMPNGWTLVVASDVSRAKNEELKLRAAHDAALRETRTDFLTGLASRRHGLERADAALSDFMTARQPLSLAIIDIDLFKRINDGFGHAVGDEVLVLFAHTLTTLLPAGDQVCRLGGEEFMVVMPDTNEELARLRLHRILLSLQPLSSRHVNATVAFTFSAGIASATMGDSLSALMRRADDALYAAKQAGRNTIRIAPKNASDAA